MTLLQAKFQASLFIHVIIVDNNRTAYIDNGYTLSNQVGFLGLLKAHSRIERHTMIKREIHSISNKI